MWWKRYEYLLEKKPVPAREVLLDMLAQEVCEVCESFPPTADAVDWQDDRLRRRFAPLMADMPKVDLPLAELLADVLVLDFEHEIEAIDHLFRNERHREACPTPLHEEALHFLWPFLVELMQQRKEECQGALKNRDLVEIARRFKEQFRRRRMRVM